MSMLQVTYMSSLLYTANSIYNAELFSYNNYIKGSQTEYGSLLFGTIVCPLVTFLISIYYLPGILTAFSTATNIEMMKDRTLVEKVICYQKFEKAKRTFRVYQVLKLVRRELILAMGREPTDKALREQTTRFVESQFKLCGASAGKEIEVANLHSLVRLCGSNLTK